MKSSLEARQLKLKARKAAIDLSLRRLAALEKERKRRNDTRAKIILGGALLVLFRNEQIVARALTPRLITFVKDTDKLLINELLNIREKSQPSNSDQ